MSNLLNTSIFIRTIVEYKGAVHELYRAVRGYQNLQSNELTKVQYKPIVEIAFNPITELFNFQEQFDYDLMTAIRMCRLEGIEVNVTLYTNRLPINHIRWIAQCNYRYTKLNANQLHLVAPYLAEQPYEYYINELIEQLNVDYSDEQFIRNYHLENLTNILNNSTENKLVGKEFLESDFIQLKIDQTL